MTDAGELKFNNYRIGRKNNRKKKDSLFNFLGFALLKMWEE